MRNCAGRNFSDHKSVTLIKRANIATLHCFANRCNVQDYIWNKGTRCDWAVTDFQVMCAVVGVASLVLIFLFMIIVFFAKRLHRLKNENRRLRKRRCVCVTGR